MIQLSSELLKSQFCKRSVALSVSVTVAEVLLAPVDPATPGTRFRVIGGLEGFIVIEAGRYVYVEA